MTTGTQLGIMQASNIPPELRSREQWVLWRSEQHNGDKPTKLPFQCNGAKAKSNDPSTWSDFQTVMERYAVGNWTGIGFCFSADDPFTGIDLDGCRDPQSGEIARWATDIIESFNSYSEVSPSQTGVKIFIRGKSPLDCGRKISVDEDRVCDKAPGIEVYDHGRYFAVTSAVLQGMPVQLEDRQDVLNQCCREWFTQPSPTLKTDFTSPDQVVERARRYVAKMPHAVSGEGGRGV